MEKTYFPTKERIEELRENGIFAYSKSTIRFIEISVIIAIIYFIKRDINFYLNIVSDCLKGKLSISIKEVLNFIVIIPAVIFPIVTVIVLLHSKFLFNFKNIFGKNSLKEKSKQHDIFFLALYPISIIFYFALVFIFSLEFLSLLNNNYKDILILIFNNIDTIVLGIMGVFFSLSVISFVLSKFLFLSKNKMSLEDIEAEKNE